MKQCAGRLSPKRRTRRRRRRRRRRRSWRARATRMRATTSTTSRCEGGEGGEGGGGTTPLPRVCLPLLHLRTLLLPRLHVYLSCARHSAEAGSTGRTWNRHMSACLHVYLSCARHSAEAGGTGRTWNRHMSACLHVYLSCARHSAEAGSTGRTWNRHMSTCPVLSCVSTCLPVLCFMEEGKGDPPGGREVTSFDDGDHSPHTFSCIAATPFSCFFCV